MNYSIIKTGGKQYQVKVGDTLEVELLKASSASVTFDEVLLHVDGDKVEVGTPTIPDFKVFATVVGTKKADKVQVFKYKSKSRYRKLRGHRQNYTLVKIDGLGTKPAATKSPKAKAEVVKAAPAKKAVAKKPAVKKAPTKKVAK